MGFFVEVTLNGLALGCIYALMGVGLALVYGVMRTLNFAYGEFYTVGGYVFALLTGSLGIALLPSALAAVVAGGTLAWLIESLLLRPVSEDRVERPVEYTLVVTLALLIFLQQAFSLVFGPFAKQPSQIVSSDLSFGSFQIAGPRVAAAAGGLVALCLLWVFLSHTWKGKMLRAAAGNRFGAEVIGISGRKAVALAFVLGGGLAALAAVFLGPIFAIYPTSGTVVVIKAFIIIAIAGLGSIWGAAVAGLLLGLVELYGSVYLDAAYRDAYSFLLLIAVLLLRPQGLFGQKEREA